MVGHSTVAIGRLIGDFPTWTQALRDARAQLEQRIRDVECQIDKQVPAVVTVEDAEEIVRLFEARVRGEELQRILRPLRLPLERVATLRQRWEWHRHRMLERQQVAQERVRRLERMSVVGSAAPSLARGKLRLVEERLLRLANEVSEVERLAATYQREFAALEDAIHGGIDRIAARIRQRSPIARA